MVIDHKHFDDDINVHSPVPQNEEVRVSQQGGEWVREELPKVFPLVERASWNER